jgi:hypothetical protein
VSVLYPCGLYPAGYPRDDCAGWRKLAAEGRVTLAVPAQAAKELMAARTQGRDRAERLSPARSCHGGNGVRGGPEASDYDQTT